MKIQGTEQLQECGAVTGGWRKLHEFRNLYPSPNDISANNVRKVSGYSRSIQWRNNKYVGSFSRKIAKERDNGERQHPAILLFKQKAPTSQSILLVNLELNLKKKTRTERHPIYPAFLQIPNRNTVACRN